jgi:hypothetical protein
MGARRQRDEHVEMLIAALQARSANHQDSRKDRRAQKFIHKRSIASRSISSRTTA